MRVRFAPLLLIFRFFAPICTHPNDKQLAGEGISILVKKKPTDFSAGFIRY